MCRNELPHKYRCHDSTTTLFGNSLACAVLAHSASDAIQWNPLNHAIYSGTTIASSTFAEWLRSHYRIRRHASRLDSALHSPYEKREITSNIVWMNMVSRCKFTVSQLTTSGLIRQMHIPPISIITMVNTFSAFVFADTLPNPTDVRLVNV